MAAKIESRVKGSCCEIFMMHSLEFVNALRELHEKNNICDYCIIHPRIQLRDAFGRRVESKFKYMYLTLNLRGGGLFPLSRLEHMAGGFPGDQLVRISSISLQYAWQHSGDEPRCSGMVAGHFAAHVQIRTWVRRRRLPHVSAVATLARWA